MMRDEKTPPIELSARTKEFALRVIRLFCSLPKNTQAQVLGKQALRSGTSVGANYREAKRSRSRAEFISIIGVCIKELDETAYWLELLVESDIVSSQKLKDLYQECDQLIAILTTISKKTKASALHTSSLNTPSPIKAG
jgi:four helix bundle protein